MASSEQSARCAQVLLAIRGEVNKMLVGQDHLLDSLLIALMTGGHILLEGVPGLAKTTAVRALAAAGLVGTIVARNASISGAECGCQAEIGTACSMAATALAELYGMGIDQIEYAAEIALEHHLGLTCDPVCGLVQIPCIERNAVAAMRAINAMSLANFLSHSRKISFDLIVKTMYQTGRDLSHVYRETSEGGLAKLYRHPQD